MTTNVFATAGAALLMDAMKNKQPTLSVFRMLTGVQRGQMTGRDFVDAVSAGLAILDMVGRAGVKISPAKESITKHWDALSIPAMAISFNRAINEGDTISASIGCVLLASRLDAVRHLLRYDAPAQKADSGPMEVIVKSMPARKSQAYIERNSAGEIVASSKVEIDA